MSEERLNEIKYILFNEHLHCYLPNVCGELLDYITNLQKENERLMQNNSYTLKLEQRNEKAIELLNREYWINEHEHNDKVIDDVLNILQGSDKE